MAEVDFQATLQVVDSAIKRLPCRNLKKDIVKAYTPIIPWSECDGFLFILVYFDFLTFLTSQLTFITSHLQQSNIYKPLV